MGRGRAKAKQTKVARDLKYRPMDTDFASLERELKGSEPEPVIPPQYADLAGEYREDEFIDAYDVEDTDEDDEDDDDADERR